MEQIGFIKSVNGNTAYVIFPKKSGCGGNCSGCGGGCAKDSIVLEIENSLNLTQGDRVLVGVQKKVFSKMIFLAYVFPALMFILGLSIGIPFFKSRGFHSYELLGGLCGFVFLLLSYFLSGKVDKKVKNKGEYNMKMIRKIY